MDSLVCSQQGFWGGGVAAIALTDHTFSSSGNSSYSFSSLSIGAAAGDRQIIVSVEARSQNSVPYTVSTVTVGGISATKICGADATNGVTELRPELWLASVPTGTTGTVAVTFSASVLQCGVGVWRMTGAATSASATATDAGTGGSYVPSKSLAIPAGGVAVGIAASSGAAGSFTWTSLTEDFDEQSGATATHSGASLASAGGSTPTITATASGSNDVIGMALASFAPA